MALKLPSITKLISKVKTVVTNPIIQKIGMMAAPRLMTAVTASVSLAGRAVPGPVVKPVPVVAGMPAKPVIRDPVASIASGGMTGSGRRIATAEYRQNTAAIERGFKG